MSKHKTKTKKEEKKDKMNNEENKNINEEKQTDEQQQNDNENNKLEERIKELEEDNKRLSDLLQRKVAEFENYKRRTEAEINNIFKYAAEPFIKKILTIYDDLGRSIEHADEKSDIKSFAEGIKMVYSNFKKLLEEEGVKKIEALGKEFDFNLHEALMRQESDDVEPNTVLHEVEPGYTYKDKVIKHTKVVVSQEKEEQEKNEG